MTARDERLSLEIAAVERAFSGCENIVITRRCKGITRRWDITLSLNGYHKCNKELPFPANKHRFSIIFPIGYPTIFPIIKFATPTYHPLIKYGFLTLPKEVFQSKTLKELICYIIDLIQYKELGLEFIKDHDTKKWIYENSHNFPTDDFKPSEELLNANDSSDPCGTYKVSLKAKIDKPLCMLSSTKPAIIYKKSGFCLRTVFTKTFFWAVVGILVAFFIIQLFAPITNNRFFAWQDENYQLAEYFEYADSASDAFTSPNLAFRKYCNENNLNMHDNASFIRWYVYMADDETALKVEEYLLYDQLATEALISSFENEFDFDYKKLEASINSISIMSESIPIIIFTTVLTFFICLGEGIYYGSRMRGLKYALIGSALAALISLGVTVATQWFYIVFITEKTPPQNAALIRAVSFALIGMTVGFCTSLPKPKLKRMAYFVIAGSVGGFIPGLFYNIVCLALYSSLIESAVLCLMMGVSISLCIATAEQLCKKGWFREIKHGRPTKEYIVTSRKTRFGSKTKNHVAFKNAANIASIHFVVIYEKDRYIMLDKKSRFGTYLNGKNVSYGILKNGDRIKIGNKLFEFCKK